MKIEDWMTDLNFGLVPGPVGGQVHEGFYESIQEVWSPVQRTLARFRENKPKSLWFTGHSLGAALAALVDDIGRWNRFLDRMRGRIEDILEWGTDGMKDHSMAGYTKLIKKSM